MRIDKFLKVSRLIKRRAVANEACDQGRITVNGKVVKASYDVKENDEIEIKSNGAETTFSEDINDIKILKQAIFEFSEKIAKNLRVLNKKARTIVLKIKYENFMSITRNVTISSATDLSNEIYDNACLLLDKNWNKEYKVRLIGLSCTNFINPDEDFKQITIFEDSKMKEDTIKKEKLTKLDRISDALRDKYGDEIVLRAKALNGTFDKKKIYKESIDLKENNDN